MGWDPLETYGWNINKDDLGRKISVGSHGRIISDGGEGNSGDRSSLFRSVPKSSRDRDSSFQCAPKSSADRDSSFQSTRKSSGERGGYGGKD